MFQRNRLASIGLIVCMILGLRTAHAQDAVAEFYRDKRITLLIGASTGGGVDLFGRLIGKHMGRFVPGNPGFNVTNVPGAGSLTAALNLYSVAPKDGTYMAEVLPGAFTQPLMQPTLAGGRAAYDPTKFSFIGNGNAETLVCIVRTDSGISKFDEVFTKELIVGTPGGGSTVHEHTVVLKEVIGAKLKLVSGYPGTREIILALERGEVGGICGFSFASAKQQLPGAFGGKDFKIIVQNGTESHPELKTAGVPLSIGYAKSEADRELLKLYYSLGQFSRAFMMPPGVPLDRVKAIQTAFIATIKDPAFQQDIEKIQAEAVPQTGDELKAMIDTMFATPPEMVQRINKILQQ